MKYNEYKNLNYAKVGEDVLAFWKQNNIFEKSVATREGNENFVFFEGPPSANGKPGIHHVMARAVKDIFCRYKTLKGFQVNRKGGWDTHGLPIELQVEKELGITKEDIGKTISVEEYNQRCRETVMRFKNQWDSLTEQMGYWVDLNNPYITFENEYIESCWALLKRLYDKGYLYKGYTIQPYSPAAGTGLSSHELNQPGCYKMVKDTTIVAQFQVKKITRDMFLFENEEENVYFLAWTTTPWTLPANTALAVGKGIKYVKVKTYNPYTHEPISVILGKDLVSRYFNPKAADLALEDYKPGDKLIPYKVVEEFVGKDLEGVEYHQLLPYVQPEKPAFRVVLGDFVTTEDGTGIVHISPTFGADDARVAAQNDIPALLVMDENGKPGPIVDKQGRFVQEITDFAGMYVKNYTGEDENGVDYKPTDVKIAIKLKEEGKAFKVEKYEHTYPHCWRTDKPVLYYPLDSWFIKTTAVKDRLIELNKTINWKPESTGTGRFGNWLENLVDWNLSRSRYWGTPLPIWRTEDGEEERCIGSIVELSEQIDRAVEKGFMDASVEINDLHRPYVDNIVLVSDSGRPMYRETDLIDVWFDSGAMPYAQWHYPLENEEQFEKNFPADFIAEGVDQTRGWFFTLHALAVMLEDSVAYKNVIANGLVLDKNGNKMSKRLGNAIDPFDMINTYGPDAVRWYMIANAPPWDNLKFNPDGVVETQRRFFGTLQNTYSFFALYANLDNFTYAEADVPLAQRTESDRWIISKLNTLVQDVDSHYEDYDPTRAARAIQDFVVDDLSNWYVRLNRKRFWKGEYNMDKVAAYQTLYTCLETIAKLAAPIAPFYTEQLYRDLNSVSRKHQEESVHLAYYPKVDPKAVDKDLEERMNLAQTVSSLVHSLRKKEMIKVRQPLQRILIPVLNEKMKQQIEAVADLILSEVNVKAIEYIDDTSGILVKKIKPNFKKLGQVYGPKMKLVAAAVQRMDQNDIAQLEREGGFEIQLNDEETALLTPDDVEISSEDIPGWLVASEGRLTVALDITITEELKQEGIARDLVNRIQNLRKDSNLEVQDKIHIYMQLSAPEVNAAVENYRSYICAETQALNLDLVEQLQDATLLDIDEYQVYIRIQIQENTTV
ncbi:isoleucyl-tRNA synthetase [Pontibacter ummariensis]|uniref:Isoleucine--tRNA ligase n=1 Tax=Pontibacter ummariensis TaxID=1610492 RepID=A0A239CI82_9BACT|nr:isoleucine--tRNA ligase [Pontibacter ummariensis]PRY15008.1 isoleucyl-tRNA synthetase [Pontibacter ummariensis]SNS19622.1 Isoleucyl-tRNA synthetase [Pontibacter ummariensis]